MKLVCKRSVKQKVDDLIDEALSKGLEIYRMELNPSDFRELDCCLRRECSIVEGISYNGGVPWQDGNYVVYRGVCIQCHSEYPKTKPQIELQD